MSDSTPPTPPEPPRPPEGTPPAGGPPLPPPAGGTPPPPPPPAPGFQGAAAPPPPAYGGPVPGTSAATYSVSDAFNWAWLKFQKNAGPWILACLIALVVLVLLGVVYVALVGGTVAATSATVETVNGTTVVRTDTTGQTGVVLLTALFAVIGTIVGWVVSAQFVRGSLINADTGKVEVGDFFKTSLLGTVIGAAAIVAVAQFVLALLGGFLPILGGIIQFIGSILIAFFLSFFAFFIFDRKDGAVQSLKDSAAFVNQNLAKIIVLILASWLALFIGAILCGIGLFVAIPVVVLANAYTYRVLNNEPVAA